MIPPSVSNALNRKRVEKGFSDGAANDVRWRILSGKSRYPEHLPLLSRAAAIFRVSRGFISALYANLPNYQL